MAETKLKVGSIEIKASPSRLSEVYDRTLDLKTYGEGNLYPNILVRLIQASPTASICRQQYADFIFGKGINGGDDIMVNDHQTLNDLVADMSEAIATFGGFPLHVTFNGFNQIAKLRCLPTETIRMGEEDSLGYVGKYWYCADWSQEKTRAKKQIDSRKDRIEYLAYSDDMMVNNERFGNVGGLENYNGEILYVSNRQGYPLPLGDSVLTLMSCEEGLDNVTYRNCRNNFLTAGVLVIPKGVTNPDEEGYEEDGLAEAIVNAQGDCNTGKILTYEVQSMSDDKPEFVDFKSTNYDKEFEVSNSNVVEKIYSAYKQDLFYTIRIGKLGFSGDVMADAYALMNLKVAKERAVIERTLKRMAKRMPALNGIELRIDNLLYNRTTGAVNV